VVIVTGGGHGIGRAYCLGIAREGGKAIVADIDGAAAEKVAREAQDQGGEALALHLDVANAGSCQEMAQATLQRYGQIDGLVNNMIHYVTSKAAVVGFSRVLARELGPFNIRLNTLAPGLTLSEVAPTEESVAANERTAAGRVLKRIERPEDLVGTAPYLLSDLSAFVTGQAILVNGGAVMH
jgi:NAD(P)-dependent dehydrogenase (short-subunit alcohol dehydrogenase family)